MYVRRYVATDMVPWRGHKVVEQETQTPVRLSPQAPLEGTGKFYRDCKEDFIQLSPIRHAGLVT